MSAIFAFSPSYFDLTVLLTLPLPHNSIGQAVKLPLFIFVMVILFLYIPTILLFCVLVQYVCLLQEHLMTYSVDGPENTP